MRLSTLLFAACLGLTSAAPNHDLIDRDLQKRACFQTGETWGSQNAEAGLMAQTACNDYFVGNYPRGRTYTRCYNLSGGKSVEFKIGLWGPNAPANKYLGSDECKGGLNSEINNCGRGGETTYGNWYYR